MKCGDGRGNCRMQASCRFINKIFAVVLTTGIFFIGPWNREQPIPGLRIHVVPRARDVRVPRQHGAHGEGGRRSGAGAHMRDDRGGREAPRERLLEDRREAARSGPQRRHDGHRGHDAEEDHHAGPPDARQARPQAFRALLGGGSN